MNQPLHTLYPHQPHQQQALAPMQAQTSRPLIPTVRALLPLLLAAACLPAAAQKVMQPGAWEITTTLTRELPQQPAESMGTHTITMCLDSDFLAREPYFDATLDAQKMAARQAQCSTADYQRQGHTASWHMRCQTAERQPVACPHPQHGQRHRLAAEHGARCGSPRRRHRPHHHQRPRPTRWRLYRRHAAAINKIGAERRCIIHCLALVEPST